MPLNKCRTAFDVNQTLHSLLLKFICTSHWINLIELNNDLSGQK